MSAYTKPDEICDKKNLTLLFSDTTGELVYISCKVCQTEEVHPKYAFNLEYFRFMGEVMRERSAALGQPAYAEIPHRRIETKVCTTPSNLAEYLFNLEVIDEQE